MGHLIKADIVQRISKEATVTRQVATDAVEIMLEAMRDSLASGEGIELRNFGSFRIAPKKTGIGRNPKTGLEVRIRPGKTVKFKPGKLLKDP